MRRVVAQVPRIAGPDSVLHVLPAVPYGACNYPTRGVTTWVRYVCLVRSLDQPDFYSRRVSPLLQRWPGRNHLR